eukprot:gene3939-7874_t
MSKKELDFRTKKIPNIYLFSCGLASGVAQAAIFNPWDRALYLSVKKTRNFLDPRNFTRPFEGLMQTISQRAMSAGLYFPLENIFMAELQNRFGKDPKNRPWINVLAGNLAGATNGLLMNPFSSIKYHSWGSDRYYSFYSTAAYMFKKGGLKTFFFGTSATVSRDLIFGGVFAFLRHEFRFLCAEADIHINSFFLDVTAGCLATIASSPLNYVRNINYSTPPDQPHITTIKVLTDLFKAADMYDSVWNRMKFIQERLKIGWGTGRVGCGMAFGSLIYSFCVNKLSELNI